jgi:hypothetical protein
MNIEYWCKSQKERDHWEEGRWTILKWTLEWMIWIGLIWLRIWTSGGLL